MNVAWKAVAAGAALCLFAWTVPVSSWGQDDGPPAERPKAEPQGPKGPKEGPPREPRKPQPKPVQGWTEDGERPEGEFPPAQPPQPRRPGEGKPQSGPMGGWPKPKPSAAGPLYGVPPRVPAMPGATPGGPGMMPGGPQMMPPGMMPGGPGMHGMPFGGPMDEEMQDLNQTDLDLDRQCNELAARLRHAPKGERDSLKTQLAELVNKHFDARQKRRDLQLKRLEEELKRLREASQKRLDGREQIIKKRVAELAGDADDLGF
jgi:hypothetical protein